MEKEKVIGFPTSRDIFSKFFEFPFFAISNTMAMSFDLSIAS